MLTTGDWRVVKDATKVSLGEALASYNGRNLHLGSEPAYRWIQGADIDACRGTVNRMAMRYDYSVEMGHEVNNGLLDWDLGELQSILLSRHGGRRLAKGELVESLNALPTRAFNEGKNAIEVIGWGIWARLF